MTIEQNEQLIKDIQSNEDLQEFESKLLDAWQFAMDKKLPLTCILEVVEMHIFQYRLTCYQQVLARTTPEKSL